MKLVLFGAPGAGKGTQAAILSKKLGIPAISTGDILRQAVANCTPVGLKAKEYMDAGGLVPDEVIIGIIAERLRAPDCERGYILDGVPRTIAQAEALERQGVAVDVTLSIEVADAEIEERLTGRRSCACGATYHVAANPPKKEGVCDKCGAELTVRTDDKPEKVKNRLETFHRETEPLKEFYGSRGVLKTVDNISGVEAMTAAIYKTLGISDD